MTVLDELLVRIGMDASGVDEGTDQVASKLDKLSGPAAAAGTLAGGVFAMGLSSAMDIQAARSTLQDQYGLTTAEAERAGDVAGDVFSDGFGESLEDVTASIGGVQNSIGNLGTFTDTQLADMSESALALAKRFEVEVTDATGAVGQLMKTGLVSDATEGFDLITKAMQTVPAELRDDVIPTIQEYSTQFRRVGLDGETSFGLIAQAVKAGARDMDQVADAIGQFGERALAGGKPVDDAFKSIGLNSKTMAKLIGAGGKSAEKALQMTMEKLRGTSDEQTKLNVAAALFGDPGNVLGKALFALDPASAAASSGMDKAAGSSKALTDSMEKDPAQQMDAAMRTLTQGLGEAFLPIVQKVSGFMAEHQGLMKTLVPIVLGLAVAFGVFAIAVWTVNAAMAASPVTWIVLGIIALIAVIVLIIVKWDEVAAATGVAWDWITAKLGTAWKWIKDTVGAVWGWISDKTSRAWNWISEKVQAAVRVQLNAVGWLAKLPGRVAGWFGQIIGWVAGLPGRIGKAAHGMWDSITSGFKSAVNSLISMWNGLSFTLGGGSFMGVPIPSVTLATPDIPYLAEGGVTTGPTLAMIGEGREDEAVLPLSKLEQMINTGGGRAPSTSKVEPLTVRTVLELVGTNSAFMEFMREAVRDQAGGSVIRFAEEG
ncbi:phage tail tape measure protein [Streptomyces sp. NPDC048332]|uniref:phage tail tape measure protein n=1 Tax=Streptomyces sp. NPDC048332 TaxID=3154619 RepID=UPI0034210861